MTRPISTRLWTWLSHLKFRTFGVRLPLTARVRGALGVYVHYDAHMSVGEFCRINAGVKHNPVGGGEPCGFYVFKRAELIIGNSVAISNAMIVCTHRIVFEDGVMIGGGTRIYDTDFHDLRAQPRVLKVEEEIKTKPICFRENCFIGAHSIILKGVTIGKESIVAAGSVVVKDVPDYEVWGGNPAKKIRDVQVEDRWNAECLKS